MSWKGTLRLTIAFALLAGAYGCNPIDTVQARGKAEVAAQHLIDNFHPGGFPEVLTMYGQQFWDAVPRDLWERALPNIHDELGAIKNCEQINWNVTTQAVAGASGTYATLTYECDHEKYTSYMQFVFRTSDGEGPHLVGHRIESLGNLVE